TTGRSAAATASATRTRVSAAATPEAGSCWLVGAAPAAAAVPASRPVEVAATAAERDRVVVLRRLGTRCRPWGRRVTTWVLQSAYGVSCRAGDGVSPGPVGAGAVSPKGSSRDEPRDGSPAPVAR